MKTVGKVVLYGALFLIVPWFVIGWGGARILEAIDPPSASAGLIEQLEHVRAQTRLILLAIAGYYVVLVAALVGRRLRRRRAPAS